MKDKRNRLWMCCSHVFLQAYLQYSSLCRKAVMVWWRCWNLTTILGAVWKIFGMPSFPVKHTGQTTALCSYYTFIEYRGGNLSAFLDYGRPAEQPEEAPIVACLVAASRLASPTWANHAFILPESVSSHRRRMKHWVAHRLNTESQYAFKLPPR